ncbi:hypothetical protein Tco_0140846 [Tanacetum coccineum]
MKGPSECKASKSNFRRIQVKDIVKEVEDYLKTYSSARMDNSWMRMEVLLRIHKVWDVVDLGSDDAKKNNIVKGLLFQSIPEDLVLQIGNLKTGKEIREAIKTHNLGADHVKEGWLQTLITEFENMKMSDNDTIDAYATKFLGIASKSAMLGEVMSKHKLVKKFLTSLPRWFVHIVASLEQVLDLKTTWFEDVVGLNIKTGIMTQAEEEDVAHTLEVVDEVEVKDMVRATRKTKYGHFVSKFLERNRNHEVNLNETQEKGVYHEEGIFFMMNHIQEMIFMNEEKYTPPMSESNTDEDDVWYFDNGTCNHMTGDYSYFSELNENISGRVSLGQAIISGYDINIRDNFLTMRDSWGSLLIKVLRSANRLYKTQLKVSKEDTNEVGQESGSFTVLCNDIHESVTNQVVDEEANSVSVHSPVHETNPKSEEDNSGSDDTSNLSVRLETIRLLIALAARK